MSWIKDNPFVVALSGITVAATGALVFFGSHSAGNYQTHLDEYLADATKVAEAEKLSIYPNAENKRAKFKALSDYRSDLGKLESNFASYRPESLKKLSGQEFIGNLKAADTKTREAFKSSKVVVPDAFFLGFEAYKTGTLAKEGATGILDYQLGAASELFLALAKAAPTELKNVYRAPLVEETGGVFDPKDSIFRPLPMEVTFTGTERSVREFITALEGSDSYYYCIRTIRINNAKDKGPSPADAKFEAAKPTGGAAGSDPFGGGGFVIPGETPAPAAAAKPAAAAAADSGRILQQVLGTEELSVFIRLDVLQFLPTKDLPKP
jgi:hypothetical protein